MENAQLLFVSNESPLIGINITQIAPFLLLLDFFLCWSKVFGEGLKSLMQRNFAAGRTPSLGQLEYRTVDRRDYA